TVRVTSVEDGNLEQPKSLMVVHASAPAPEFKVGKRTGEVVLTTARVAAHVSLVNGTVTFKDADGTVLLAEEPLDASPDSGVMRRFNAGTDEAFYGAGQHQNAQLNLNGEDVELAQHNIAIAVP